MSELGSATRPLRVAIVGSGPSGFYAAEALFKSGLTVHIDMFDRLPTPFGLVRGGVAPDHPKIKTVTRIYDRIASLPGFSFWGNVHIGRDLPVALLKQHYDAQIFASGAESDNHLGIPGEDLHGSHTATEFVGWYNGHPDYCNRHFELNEEIAVVVGQGNVAMDVSRILAKTVDELKNTDIAQHALDALAESKVKEIHLIGRRGPVQAKFTTPEIKELGELKGCSTIVSAADLVFNEASQIELNDEHNQHSQKNIEILHELAGRTLYLGHKKRLYIHFLKGPVELRGNNRVDEVVLERNTLIGEPGHQSARGTGEFETMRCGLFFRSVGYRGIAIPGVPFDSRRGTIPNAGGRVTDGGNVVSGMYCTGWIKRGPSGVIGTNKQDSQATVELMLADVEGLAPCAVPDTAPIADALAEKGVRVVTMDDWRKLDEAEIARGQSIGKPREKFTRVDDMLAALDAQPVA